MQTIVELNQPLWAIILGRFSQQTRAGRKCSIFTLCLIGTLPSSSVPRVDYINLILTRARVYNVSTCGCKITGRATFDNFAVCLSAYITLPLLPIPSRPYNNYYYIKYIKLHIIIPNFIYYNFVYFIHLILFENKNSFFLTYLPFLLL